MTEQCPTCERVGLCADCCEDGAFSDPAIHQLLTSRATDTEQDQP